MMLSIHFTCISTSGPDVDYYQVIRSIISGAFRRHGAVDREVGCTMHQAAAPSPRQLCVLEYLPMQSLHGLSRLAHHRGETAGLYASCSNFTFFRCFAPAHTFPRIVRLTNRLEGHTLLLEISTFLSHGRRNLHSRSAVGRQQSMNGLRLSRIIITAFPSQLCRPIRPRDGSGPRSMIAIR